MNAAGRLTAYVAVLAGLFTAAFAVADAVVPEQLVLDWKQSAEQNHGH